MIASVTDLPALETAAVRRQSAAGWRRHAGLAVGLAGVLLVAAPLLFTSSGFGLDFTNHLWLSWVQGEALLQAGHPSYFLSARGIGVFYPFFAFYGGTLYALTGGLSDLLGGQPVAAYVGLTITAIAGTYGGAVWLGRELGLRGPMVHAPALAIVTSAYYITNLYGRGAWPEFMAVAVIAPLLASGVHLVRAPAWRVGPVAVFVVSAVIFSGSHNITLLWGTSVIAVALVVLWLGLGAPRRLPARRLAMLAGLALACVAVNGWFLLPDVAYATDVAAHLEVAPSGATATFFDTSALLFDPLRAVPARSTTPGLFVQVPVWFLAWGVLAGVALLWRRGAGRELRRVWICLTILLATLLCMILITPIWRAIPFPFNQIQFPYRLSGYVFYAVGGLVLVGALALQRATGSDKAGRVVSLLGWGLAWVCAISVGLCVWQLWAANTLFPNSYRNRAEALASVHTLPRTWYDPIAYTDVQAPVVRVPAGRVLFIAPSSVHGDRFTGLVNAPAGMAPIQTNIAGGAYVVRISGLRRVGRGANDWAVVQRETNGSGPVHVVVETAHNATIELGRMASALGSAVVLAVLASASVGGYRARRASGRAVDPRPSPHAP